MTEQASKAQDDLLLSRVRDAVRLSKKRNTAWFIGFLDERQQHLSSIEVRRNGCTCFDFWGGYAAAERTMLGVGTSDEFKADFPIQPLELTYRAQDVLTHRDFLGALMGLGLKRETIGDILVGEGRCVLFAESTAAGLILDQIQKIGRVGVSCHTADDLSDLPQGRGMYEITGTVPSLRLDCVMHAALNLSRTQCAELIKSGAVTVDFVPCMSADKRIDERQKISVRGYGRFFIDSIGGVTKKGRNSICIKRYK